jgi:hypothetical protein
MLGAIDPWRGTDDRSFKLHGIEVTPTSLRSMIVNIAIAPAIWADWLLAFGPLNENIYPKFPWTQINLRHLPWISQPKQKAVMLVKAFISISAHSIHLKNLFVKSNIMLNPSTH